MKKRLVYKFMKEWCYSLVFNEGETRREAIEKWFTNCTPPISKGVRRSFVDRKIKDPDTPLPKGSYSTKVWDGKR